LHLLLDIGFSSAATAGQHLCGEQLFSGRALRFGLEHGALHVLLSDASTFVTGTVLAVDGGFSCFSGV
ncbi:MAG: D-mannonate oxidoreductase, partial [Verrucomicrobiota bacterium]